MIRKETIKKTRDFLNAVKRGLSTINRGHISPQEMAFLHDVSRARFSAAVNLGYFKPVGRRGRGFIYKSTVPYFNEDMAAAVIRREYNMYAVRKVGGEPVVARKEERDYTGRGREEVGLQTVTDWLRIHGYEGLLYKQGSPETKVVL